MKTKEVMRNLRAKEIAALYKELLGKEAEILKISVGESHHKDTSTVSKHKKEVARILTVLKEKEK
jgi:ribosomal protein L29